MKTYTVKEYAVAQGISESKARRELKNLTRSGNVVEQLTWRLPDDDKCFTHRIPPAHKVMLYHFNDVAVASMDRPA